MVPLPSMLETLRAQMQQFGASHNTVSCGIAALDRLLPGGGLQRGSLIEWLSEGPGAGAGTLAMLAARTICQASVNEETSAAEPGGAMADGGGELFADAKPLIVVDPQREFYPPAMASLGIDLQRTIFVQPRTPREVAWTLEQTLRCTGVGAVLACKPLLDDIGYRRLQLASETGGGLGLFLRPASCRSAPSPASLRLLVEPLASGRERRIRLQILRCRGTAAGREITLGIDDETGDVRLATELANPATVSAARA